MQLFNNHQISNQLQIPHKQKLAIQTVVLAMKLTTIPQKMVTEQELSLSQETFLLMKKFALLPTEAQEKLLQEEAQKLQHA